MITIGSCGIHAPIQVHGATEPAVGRPQVRIPMTQWVLYEPCEVRECSVREREWFGQRVSAHVSRVKEILASHRAGIMIDQRHPVRVRHLSGNDELLDADCRNVTLLKRFIGHAPGTLNVYYLRKPGARGFWCPPDTILLAVHAYPQTVAHEIGHAFGLVHFDSDDPALQNNLMNSRGRMTDLTAQQVLEINLSAESFVRAYRVKAGKGSPH